MRLEHAMKSLVDLENRPARFATFKSIPEHVIMIIILFQRLIFNSQTNCLGQRKFVYEGTLFKVKVYMVTFAILLPLLPLFSSANE